MKDTLADKLRHLSIPEDASFEWLVAYAKNDFWSVEVYGNKYIARSFGDRKVSVYVPDSSFNGLQAIGNTPSEALMYLLVKIHAPDNTIIAADVDVAMNELREVFA
jgi:dTDP-4-dehydrorhamnose 3,5-epimerase-like enzyme